MPPHSCACFIRAKLSGFNALAPRRKPRRDEPRRGRLRRGPAYGQVVAVSQGAERDDWPTYRHDAARSGSTKSTVPAALKRKWQAQLGGGLTSPVVVDGKVFVASVDTHTVYALDANNSKTLWSYTARGRVDSPPTIYKEGTPQGGNPLALFGSADGWVYCLRASDGKLVWRFRAAPEERRVVAYGQLESAWPVHGSVLVQDDVAYFAAGRSSYLDGGIYLYRLDPKTAKLLSETCINSRDPKTGEQPKGIIRGTDMPGVLPDVLSSDGTFIYMRHMRFDRNGVEQEPSVPHLYSPAGFLDDSWWHRTYWLVGTRMGCAYGGWPTVGNIVPSGRLLVFDASNIYGFGRNQYGTHGSHIGLGRTHFRLFAASRKPLSAEKPAPAASRLRSKPAGARKPNKKPTQKTAVKKKKQRRGRTPVKSTLGAPKRQRSRLGNPVNYHWSQQAPLVTRAMVLADTTLFLAGPPDSGNGGADALAVFEGGTPPCGNPKKGAILYVASAQDGKKLAEYDLESLPVFDGMAAANGRLYLTMKDGKVLCFAGEE